MRRGLIVGAVAFTAIGAVGTAQWSAQRGQVGTMKMTVQEVYRAARAGDLLLIDIRRPDEWSRTGVGQGAIPIDMRRDDFMRALQAHAAQRQDVPIALICARGVRSARLANRLEAAGFSQIIDVPEGMLGSQAGPGWLAQNLPVRPM